MTRGGKEIIEKRRERIESDPSAGRVGTTSVQWQTVKALINGLKMPFHKMIFQKTHHFVNQFDKMYICVMLSLKEEGE